MFRHLLVPLDGSALAEAVLPVAAHLAQCLPATVTLLHSIERNAPRAVHGERHLTNAAEARDYLAAVAARAFAASTAVTCHVHEEGVSRIAASIAAHAGELRPDLVLLCAHGRNRLLKRLFGSVGQRVVALGETPVLLVHPAAEPDQASAPCTCRRSLVCLDGEARHEYGLQVAIELARQTGAALHLLRVVQTLNSLGGREAASGQLLPGTTSELLSLAAESAEAYLAEQAAKVTAGGLVVSTEVARGDPATAIVAVAARAEVDLIVCGTHGRVGMNAFWEGNVPARVTHQTRLPLLLVPLPKTES